MPPRKVPPRVRLGQLATAIDGQRQCLASLEEAYRKHAALLADHLAEQRELLAELRKETP